MFRHLTDFRLLINEACSNSIIFADWLFLTWMPVLNLLTVINYVLSAFSNQSCCRTYYQLSHAYQVISPYFAAWWAISFYPTCTSTQFHVFCNLLCNCVCLVRYFPSGDELFVTWRNVVSSLVFVNKFFSFTFIQLFPVSCSSHLTHFLLSFYMLLQSAVFSH